MTLFPREDGDGKSKSNYGVITQRELTVRNTQTILVIYSSHLTILILILILTILANNLTIPTIKHL